MITDVSKIAKMFNKSEEFTDAMLRKHGVTSLPLCRVYGDGLDEFYSDMSSFYSEEPSLTKQEFTESCDPNFVLERHARGQDISLALKTASPVYGDFTDIPASYHEALTLVTRANQSFNQLDARVRARFDNDPAQFVDFIKNPDNAQAVYDMGFAEFKATISPEQAPAPASVDGGGEGA